MRSSLVKALVAVAGVPLLLSLAACGGDDNETKKSGVAPPKNAKRGGHLTVLFGAGDIDYIDPGSTYYSAAVPIFTAVQRQLYYYKPDQTGAPTPDLAAAQPTYSKDRQTITIKLRHGVKFTPPVSREVTSKDFKYALERIWLSKLSNGYVTTYFTSIQGVPKAPGDKVPNISGIQTPDPYTLVIKLTRKNAVTVAGALALQASVPVPREYAAKFDKDKDPAAYGLHQVFTGPYMIPHDSKGKLTGYKPGRQIQLVRNPSWSKATDPVRPAYLDSITVDEGNTDTTVASRRILRGESLVNGDFNPPAPVLKEALRRYKKQFIQVPSGGFRYIGLNSTKKPFDNINVRKAVIAGMDKNALRLTRGGAAVGPIATHFLPPGFKGFEEAGGLKGPDLDYLKYPSGNLQVAAKYFKAAGYKSGKYEGKEKLLMIGDNSDPANKTAQVAQEQFKKLGFNVQLRTVEHSTMYTKFCDVPKNQPPICPNVGWFKDFFDPGSMLGPTFTGPAIVESGNVNWGQLDVPAINKAAAKADLITDPIERGKAWAQVDRLVMENAPGVPWVWDYEGNLASKNVLDVPSNYMTFHDLNFTSLK